MSHLGKTIIVQTTDEMDNWLHPQTLERKQRIKETMSAAAARAKQRRDELDHRPSSPKSSGRGVIRAHQGAMMNTRDPQKPRTGRPVGLKKVKAVK